MTHEVMIGCNSHIGSPSWILGGATSAVQCGRGDLFDQDGTRWDKSSVVLEGEGGRDLRSVGRSALLVGSRLRGMEGKKRTSLDQLHCRRLFSCFLSRPGLGFP